MTVWLIATVLIGPAVYASAFPKNSPWSATQVLFTQFCMSQLTLLAVWAVLGRANVLLRTALGVTGVLLWVMAVRSVCNWPGDLTASDLCLQTVITALGLLPVRLSNRRLDIGEPVTQIVATKPFQVTLSSLLMMLPVVSIGLAVGRYLAHVTPLTDLRTWALALTDASSQALPALVAVYLILPARPIIVRLLALCATDFALVSGIVWAIDKIWGIGGGPWPMTRMVLIETTFVVVSLLLLRYCGLQLVRSQAITQARATVKITA